ncbi:protein translocase subunit yidC [Parasphingorhabdus marina DSM 22363]|uniref:Membrane protein insertase YidC n=1 Tax=Parasphingorhabdus marina DSM 22363 TaxID=1123272 RepID=A0A1N6CMY9_9SPHN|nr:membrane protein insertase YidC [Parasphingorhabdus marina]SIN59941.1 protein translocase subunit yidC [Parasphingorhabdus marina DSM 22363]
MDDKRNIIMAVLLTGIILFGWPLVMEQFFPEMVNQNEATEQAASPAADPASADGLAPAVSTDTGANDIAADAVAGTIRPLAAVLRENPRVLIDTPRLKGSINLQGARFDDLTLTDYRVALDKDSDPVRLFSPSGTENAYFSRFGWAGKDIALPGDKTVWSADQSKLTPETPVTLSWNNDTGQSFAITLSIDENYLVTAEQSVTNRGEADIAVNPFGLLSRVRNPNTIPSVEQDSWTIHIGPMGVFEETANFDTDYEDVEEAGASGVSANVTNGWIGFTDKYWLGALIPVTDTKIDGKFRAGSGDVYQAQISRQNAQIVAPGKVLTTTTRLFAGAKETALLDTYKEQYNITLLDRAIDWGWFYWFEKPLFYLLNWLFEMVGNFGVAIILMTFVVRGIMFPIAQKQFASMAQMRAVQPKMKKIQEKHKDDKQKQQQEIMKLYKDEKVNPLAGCLPIFLQIPIFFALYKVLMLSIEMRHQPFMLWIKDLSAPDPLTPVNLFGLIPFDPPSFLAVGILPILMGITMHFQFKLNPQQMDPIQQQIFSFMPWILVFIMAPFAAGLQLYWTVSNILTIIQQKWLYSRHPQLKEMMAKEAEEKARKEAEAKG